jgi:hypothetical protein
VRSHLSFGSFCILISVAGCTRWEPYRLPAPSPSVLPTSLRVWPPAGRPIVLTKPVLRSDRLVGHRAGDTVSVAIAAIERLERPRIAVLRTAATAVGGLAAWLTVGILAGGLE